MKRFFFWWGLLLIFVPLGLWLVYEPGHMTFEWFGYRLQAHAFIVVMLVLWQMASMVLLTRLWLWLVEAPRHLRVVREQKQTQRSLQALTRGFVALAAGESVDAQSEADTIDKNKPLPALSLLLRAQAALQQNKQEQASQHFAKMLETPETAFLARRGLAQYALQQGNTQRAIDHLQQAHQLQPTAIWPLRGLLTVYTGSQMWQQATDLLHSKHGKRAFSAQQKNRALAVIAYQRGQDALNQTPRDAEGAYEHLQASIKYDSALIVAFLLKASLEKQNSKRKKALQTLTLAWNKTRHPDIIQACYDLYPSSPPEKHYQIIHKLCEGATNEPQCRLALSDAAIKAQWWAQAEEWLAPLSTKAPLEACIYQAQIHQAQGRDEQAQQWQRKAQTAHPLYQWFCQSCGTPQPQWHDTCPQCQSFATTQWQKTQAPTHSKEATPESYEPFNTETAFHTPTIEAKDVQK